MIFARSISTTLLSVPMLATYSIIIIIAKVVDVFLKYSRKKRGITLADTSVLLSYYTEGKELLNLKSGTLENFSYGAFATNDASTLIYRVQLPFATKVHLLGIPKDSDTTQLNPANIRSIMEKVHLEGDYETYFALYAERGQQTQSRYVLDPKAMSYTVQFCRAYSWEILGNELYFVQTVSAPEFKTILPNFIKEIRPSIEIPLTKQEQQLAASYGTDVRNDLLCPLCHESMKNIGTHFACPNNDGILLSGKNLNDLRNNKLKLNLADTGVAPERTQALQCPSCGNTMELLAYNSSDQIIDTCTHCPYRWLDTHDALKIGAFIQ